MEKYSCLNCGEPLSLDEDSKHATTCKRCSWTNRIGKTAEIPNPIVLKTITLEDHSIQTCYPLIEEKDLENLPDKLREYVLIYFKEPKKFNNKMFQHIYHNLIKKDINSFEKIAKRYSSKAKLAKFFQSINAYKESEVKNE